MAGRKSRSDGRQTRASSTKGSRGRKTHVPPIIDLEATIVEDKDAAETEPREDASASASGPERAPGGGEGATSWQDDQPASWMEEMKTFFLGGVHIGRWRIPAAGSLIVLAIFAGGLVGGRLSAPEVPTGDAAGERFTALEAMLKDAAEANADLASRFGDLNAKLDAATANARDARSAADAALSEVRALDASLQDLAAASPDGGDNAVQAALQEQIAALSERLEQIASNVTAGEGTGTPDELDNRIAALASALEELQGSVEELAARAPVQPGDGDTIAQSVIDAAKAQIAESMEEALVRVDARLAALENGLDAPPREGPEAATAAAADLNRAIDAGSPYQRELAAFAAAMPGDPAVSAIAPYATTGVATRADLMTRFETVAAELSARAPADSGADKGEEGVIDDVWSRVTRLVEVQKSTEPGSRVLVGAVEKAGERIAEGDLDGAADALAAGGEGLTDAATDWIDATRARSLVDAQMDGLLRRAVLKSSVTDDPSGS